MPPRPQPISTLARRQAEQMDESLRRAPKSIGRLAPVQIGGGGLSLNPMPALRQAVNWFRTQPGTNISTPINTGRGVSMGGQGGASQLVFDPAAQAVERAVGDITAIPGVGQPSPSYTAEQIRQQGVLPGVLGAAMDYAMFLPGALPARQTVRTATADAAERLAQSMAAREMGLATAALPDRPTVTMKPFVYDPNAIPNVAGRAEGILPGMSIGPDNSLSLIDESGVSRLTPIEPTSAPTPRPRPKTPAELELEMMQMQTSTPDQIERKLQRAFQTGRRDVAARNPTQRNVDWSVTNPTNEADLTKVFTTETDLMFADPLTADKWRAQQAFLNEVVPFIESRNLTPQFMGDLYFPGRSGAADLRNLVAAEDIRGMMNRVPELQRLYVDVMKLYGF